MDAASARTEAAPPSIARRTLHLVLHAFPGRLRNTLILVAGVTMTTAIWEVFRIPDASTSCYVVLFISRGERTSTVASAVGILVLGLAAMVLAILVTMASLSEPALRMGLMALLTFGAMFLSRAARQGTPFFAVGFLMVYALTISDSVLQLGLQAFTSTDTNGTALPALLFIPPEEALLRTLLWLILSTTIPPAIVVLLNRAFGLDPAVMLRKGLGERLAACAAVLRGMPGTAARLETIARRGSAELAGLAALAQKDHGAGTEPLDANSLAIHASSRLMLACLALDQLRPGAGAAPWMERAARRCGVWHDAAAGPQPTPETGDVTDDPIAREIGRALDDMEQARVRKGVDQVEDEARSGTGSGVGAKLAAGFWADDAGAAVNVQFALKVTLSVMICYMLNNALDWQGIGTSVVTCFFVALGSLGESGHKMTLRLVGCLVGSALAIGSVILLMPVMTDLGHLLALVGAVTFLAAWIAVGSQRISYAGWQISLAFYTVVLQGFGPVTDMEGAKNRIIGILLGIVVSYVVHATLWPVRVDRLVAASLADALEALVRMLRKRDEAEKARDRFSAAITKTQTLLLDGMYEGTRPHTVRLDEGFVRQVQALVLPVSMLAASRERPYDEVLATWLTDVAGRLRRGRLTDDSPPPPLSPASTPAVTGCERDMFALLDRNLAALPLLRPR